MHEFAIVESLLREARKQGEPESVEVVIGELTGLTKDEFGTVFKVACDYGLKMEYERGRINCLKCGFEGKPKILAKLHTHCLMECPKCGGRKLEVLAGDKIILKSVKVDVNKTLNSPIHDPHGHRHEHPRPSE